MRETEAVVAANRFGLGAAPGEIRAIAGDPRGALKAQLAGAAPLIGQALPGSHELLAGALQLRADAAGERQAGSPQLAAAVQTIRDLYAPAHAAEVLARFREAVSSQRSFLERLVHFWSNHFAVSVDKVQVLGLAGAMEREAIRPHVLGSFAGMLLAVEQHPAMLLYLDNQASMGSHSQAARLAGRRGRTLGLNENLGREILELHTLGVDGGYTQEDVRALATLVSGWSIGGGQGRLRGGEPGRFHFRSAFHEPGAQRLLGRRYGEEGLAQGERALRDLARHPATARHLAGKLARHFVADEPPPTLVESLAQVWLRTEGDLRSVYGALLDAAVAWEKPLAKFKTPADYIHSTWRALQLPVAQRDVRLFEQLGQRPFAPGSPAGWPDRSADWDGPAALMKRLEWAQESGGQLGSRRNARQLAVESLGPLWSASSAEAVARAQDAAQALTLWLGSPEFMRR
ncbi:MAG TPA: DUF1800 domain-containing protein [Steroidobacteraceae bacterium]|nr:DUF1800 domain-containing protein [Steroidobacteraceae bacterium]